MHVLFDPARRLAVQRALHVVALKPQHFSDALDHLVEALGSAPVIPDANRMRRDVGMKDRREHATHRCISRVALGKRDLEAMFSGEIDALALLAQRANPHHLAPLVQPDGAAPTYLLELAPTLLAGLVFAGILAAIMSTADSFVNIGSAALVRDLPRALGRTLSRELLWGRVTVVVIAAAAGALAIVSGDLIAILGTFAFGTFGAALAPALAIGLNWKRVTASAAIASMLVGIVVNLGLEVLARSGVTVLQPGVLPTAVSLAASFTVLFLVSWLSTPKPGAIDDDVAFVMDH